MTPNPPERGSLNCSASELAYYRDLAAEVESRKKEDPTRYAAIIAPSCDKILEMWHSTAKIKFCHGGNRSGKTENAAIEEVWFLKGEHPYRKVPPPPVKHRISVVDDSQLHEVMKEKLLKYLPPSLYKGGSWDRSYQKDPRILTLANGSTVQFVTHGQSAQHMAGSSLHRVWIDEECPEEHYNEHLARLLDTGGDMVVTMTPDRDITWSYDALYVPSLSPDAKVARWQISTYENRFLKHADIVALEAQITNDRDRKRKIYGDYTAAGELFLENFNPDLHVYHTPPPHWDSEAPPFWWVHAVAIDPGWDHPAALIWGAKDPKTNECWLYHESGGRHLLPEAQAAEIFRVNASYGLGDVSYVIDSQANARDLKGKTPREEYLRVGLPAAAATKDWQTSREHWERLLKANPLPTGPPTLCHIHARCTNLLHQIPRYRAKRSSDGRLIWPDEGDDSLDAARYLLTFLKDRRPREERSPAPRARGLPGTGY